LPAGSSLEHGDRDTSNARDHITEYNACRATPGVAVGRVPGPCGPEWATAPCWSLVFQQRSQRRRYVLPHLRPRTRPAHRGKSYRTAVRRAAARQAAAGLL